MKYRYYFYWCVCTLVSVPYRENGYEDKIKLIKGKLEEVELPVDKVLQTFPNFLSFSSVLQVDVIISEWMVSGLINNV